MPTPIPSCRRFTLVEMLIVIAIIAILASLLMPSLHKALQRAKGVACMGGPVKNIGTMLNLYAADYHNCIPPTCNSGSKGQKWFMAFWNAGYLNNGREMWCPVTPFTTWGGYYNPITTNADHQSFGSMATAVYANADGYIYGEGDGYYRLNKLKRPEKQIFVGDASLNLRYPIDTKNKGYYIIRPSMQNVGPEASNGSQGRVDGRHANCAALVNFGGNAELFQFIDRTVPWLTPPFGQKYDKKHPEKTPEYHQRCTNAP